MATERAARRLTLSVYGTFAAVPSILTQPRARLAVLPLAVAQRGDALHALGMSALPK